MIKAICLDVGNVLVNLDMEPFRKAVSKQMNISKAETDHFINRIQKKQDLGITNITDELVTHFDIKSEYILDELMNAWDEVITPNVTSLSFFSSLIQKYKLEVALLSNIGINHAKKVDKIVSGWEDDNYRCTNGFRYVIKHYSCFVGARKPTPLYYKLFLEANPQFNGALYLDDLQENLDTGADMNFQTVKYDLSKPDSLWHQKALVEHYFQILEV